jgi:hypothetical protein
MGSYAPTDVCVAEDSVAYINERCIESGIEWISFGWQTDRGYWRYYPKQLLSVPIAQIPPLPSRGQYRVVTFDERLMVKAEAEFWIEFRSLELRCHKSDGRLSIGAKK